MLTHTAFGLFFPPLRQRIFTLITQAQRRIVTPFLSPPTPSRRSLELIFSHDYWTRVWIVQEIAFRQEVTIHFGSMCITWQSVSNFTTKLLPKGFGDEYLWGIAAWSGLHTFYHIPLSSQALRGLRQICLITSLRSNISNGKFEDLVSLLSLLGEARAFDPRDKIYGVLSLVQEKKASLQTSPKIQADYTLPTRILYIGLAQTYLSQTAEGFDARILLYAGVGWPRTLNELP
jgi:hypothetical protein